MEWTWKFLMLKSTKATDTEQHARFLEIARALGCDEDEAAFNEKLRGITGPKSGSSSIAVGTDSDPENNKTKAVSRNGTLK